MVTAYQGFCTFRRHDRAVNWLGFASAVGLYVGAYLAVASAVPAGGTVPVAAAAVVAAAAAGLWLGWLYGRAVGSPYGNVMLALGIPPLVPWPVYATPFPGLAATGDTWAHPIVVAPAALGGLVSVLWAVDRAYGRMDDPAA